MNFEQKNAQENAQIHHVCDVFSNNILINMNIFKYGYNEINVQGVLDLLTSYGFSS